MQYPNDLTYSNIVTKFGNFRILKVLNEIAK